MQTSLKITIICMLILTIIVGAYLAVNYHIESTPSCTVEPPFSCVHAELKENGMLLTIANDGDHYLFIHDLSLSQQGKQLCVYPRSPGSVDFLPAHRATAYFITADHLDGRCLMEGMRVNQTYDVVLHLTYELNKTLHNASGKIRVRFDPGSVRVPE